MDITAGYNYAKTDSDQFLRASIGISDAMFAAKTIKERKGRNFFLRHGQITIRVMVVRILYDR